VISSVKPSSTILAISEWLFGRITPPRPCCLPNSGALDFVEEHALPDEFVDGIPIFYKECFLEFLMV
jgi:hypothetical protein